MTVVLKRLWWKRKNLVSYAWLLRSTRKEICDWKMSQTFWRSPALQLEPERESPKPKRLLSSQILFTSDYSNMVVKFTKESTSQSFQRNFLMITAENKTKRQKNGNVHEYTYYRCTKKSKVMKCKEMSLRSEKLDEQLSSLIKKVSLIGSHLSKIG